MPKRQKEEITHDDPPKKQKPNANWAMGLLKTMDDPKSVVKSDDLVTVIKDAYPKAEFHFLVLPRENISNLKTLNKDHIDLIKHMENVAKEIVNNEIYEHRKFRLGYHSEASMFRLHLHVISDDMNSTCVKTKKHWNSFNTEFFLKAKDVRQSLKENGKVTIPSREACKEYLETPLKCHKCDYLPKHMPDLKMHILQHLK